MLSKLTYQMHRSGAALTQVQSDIMTFFGRSFTPTRVFTVTWKYAETFPPVSNVSMDFIQTSNPVTVLSMSCYFHILPSLDTY